MRFPTMWYVRPAKPQISLRICTVWSEPLLVAWIFMTVKLLTEHHLEFLGLTGGFSGLSESTLVKMPHCWKSHVAAQLSHATFLSCGLYVSSLWCCGLVGRRTSWSYSREEILQEFLHILCDTVSLEIFARVLFSRNFAYAKFHENKIQAKWQNYSVVYWYKLILPLSRFLTSQLCVLMLLPKIKFSQKFPNLQ